MKTLSNRKTKREKQNKKREKPNKTDKTLKNDMQCAADKREGGDSVTIGSTARAAVKRSKYSN